MTKIEKASAFIDGLSRGDPALATRHLDPERYVEHDPRICDGIAGVRRFAEQAGAEGAVLKIIRAYEDGSYVVIQADGQIAGHGTFFDVFRFEHGRVVEHWGFSAPAGPPNKSGHTQVDGPVRPNPDEDTEKNKALVRDYYETVHLGGHHDAIRRFCSAQYCARHEPRVEDGVEAFIRDVSVLTRDRTIDEIKLLVGQNDFVFLAAGGTHQDAPCLYIDLYRVAAGLIVEHWGFPMPVPPEIERKNGNAML